MKDLQGTISKEAVFQMLVKAINNTVNLHVLVLTLLVFRAYLHIYTMDLLALSII